MPEEARETAIRKDVDVGLGGHFWTIWPWMRHAALPGGAEPGRAWSGEVPDDRWGRVRLSGRLHDGAGHDRLLLVVHGLGGCVDSYYMPLATAAGLEAGFDVLRLNLRGADGEGEDIYHAGLTADLAAAVASPEAARYGDVAVLGFSMGGHASLCFAAEADDARVRAVAAVSAPLDLGRSVDAFDRDVLPVYRRHVLAGLRDVWQATSRRRGFARDAASVRDVRTIREWDERTVVPRFGFRDADEYYETQSAVNRLDGLRVPALLVTAEDDPMVLARTIRPAAEAVAGRLRVLFSPRGGHVGFPARLDLGLPGGRGVMRQAVGWLDATLRGD